MTNREAADYRIHNINAYIDDLRVPRSERLSAEKFTQDDIDSALETAERVLASLGRGTWEIDSYSVDESVVDSQKVYVMSVRACPVYNGVKTIRLPQLESLKSEDAYASNYYFEEISFRFSGGRMTSFEYLGPLDLVSVLNENVAVLSGDEIMNAFEAHSKLDDIKGYQIGGIPEELVDQVPQVVSVTAQVDSVSFGLVRTRIKNNEADFYLLPAYTFSGDYSCTYSNGMEEPGEGAILTTVNAVDGSIINTKLGY